MKNRTLGAGVFFAALAAALFGFSSTASAAVIYEATNVNIKISGGEAIAMNACINDAQDGVINVQINACNQIATAGNLVDLQGVSIWVLPANSPNRVLFSRSNVEVKITGGLSVAINKCINDSYDGFINFQQNSCAQAASAGNLVNLSGVGVVVLT